MKGLSDNEVGAVAVTTLAFRSTEPTLAITGEAHAPAEEGDPKALAL